jgi:hypothetical protein
VHGAVRGQLLDLLPDEVLGEVDVPEPDPSRWREQVTAL